MFGLLVGSVVGAVTGCWNGMSAGAACCLAGLNGDPAGQFAFGCFAACFGGIFGGSIGTVGNAFVLGISSAVISAETAMDVVNNGKSGLVGKVFGAIGKGIKQNAKKLDDYAKEEWKDVDN